MILSRLARRHRPLIRVTCPTLDFVRHHSEQTKKDCWSCEKPIKCCSLVCSGCKTIQAPEEAQACCTFFETFSAPRNYEVDLKALESKYWDLQKALHPDLKTNCSEKEREYSAQLSAYVNQSYSLLKEPVTRAQYLLKLEGIDVLGEGGSTAVDPMLLMEVMEAREELQECTTLSQLRRLSSTNQQAMNRCLLQLTAAFRERQLQQATELTVRLQYLTRIAEEADEKEETLQAVARRCRVVAGADTTAA